MSALLSVFSLWFIWKLSSCIIFNENEYLYSYACYAIIFMVISIVARIIESLTVKKDLYFSYSAMFSSIVVAGILLWSDWKLALVCLVPSALSMLIMSMIRKSRNTISLKGPMTCYTVALNSTFLFLIAYGINIARSGITQEFMNSFMLAVIIAPSISDNLRPSISPQDNGSNIIGSLACALQNLTLIFPAILIYSFLMYMFLLLGTGSSIQNQTAVFYLSTGFVCAFMILFSSWLKYSVQTSRKTRIIGTMISTAIIGVSFLIYAIESLNFNTFILFVLIALRLKEQIP